MRRPPIVALRAVVVRTPARRTGASPLAQPPRTTGRRRPRRRRAEPVPFAGPRRLDVVYDSRPAGSIARSGSRRYVKTGSDLQCNTEKGDTADAVGKVVLYQVSVIHAG